MRTSSRVSWAGLFCACTFIGLGLQTTTTRGDTFGYSAIMRGGGLGDTVLNEHQEYSGAGGIMTMPYTVMYSGNPFLLGTLTSHTALMEASAGTLRGYVAQGGNDPAARTELTSFFTMHVRLQGPPGGGGGIGGDIGGGPNGPPRPASGQFGINNVGVSGVVSANAGGDYMGAYAQMSIDLMTVTSLGSYSENLAERWENSNGTSSVGNAVLNGGSVVQHSSQTPMYALSGDVISVTLRMTLFVQAFPRGGGITQGAGGTVDFLNTAEFPTLTPVFDLPEGWTANSLDGTIVDNMFTPAPEPGSAVLAGLGAAVCLCAVARKRRRKSK